MKSTDFSKYLQRFFTEYMPSINGNSPATVDSYRYTFMQFLEFMNTEKRIRAEKLTIADFTYRNALDFYEWLEESLGNCVATRNMRQAGINSFARYLMYEYPDYISEYQRILAIPSKKAPIKEISYVKADGMKFLLAQTDKNSKTGFRDYTILSILFTTGIRVSELIGIRVKDVMLQEPPTLLVHGKGGKSRYVPIVPQIVPLLNDYLSQNNLLRSERREEYLFLNHMRQPFTRQGINYIVKKYRDAANKKCPNSIPEDFSPHKIRHSMAMSLLAADVDLIYIRDMLGHSSVRTTEVYARAESQRKRAAIEAASKEIVETEPAQWDNNEGLIEWLKRFNHTA